MTPAAKDTTVGDLRRLHMTLPQAASILDVDVRQIRKAVDRHAVTTTIVLQGKQRTRHVNGVDVLYLRFEKIFEKTLCRELLAQLTKAPDHQMLTTALHLRRTGNRAEEQLAIDPLIHDMAAKTAANILSLGGLTASIDKDGNIRGTDIAAHRIAALVGGGMSVDEVSEDYPNLSDQQIEAAVRYAAANPKPGRPFPSCTVKSVLRNGGGGGLGAAFAAARDDEDGT